VVSGWICEGFAPHVQWVPERQFPLVENQMYDAAMKPNVGARRILATEKNACPE